jgi:hypothetical protein
LLEKATIRLKSKDQAEAFLKVLAKTKYITELDIEMGWTHTESDLKELESALSDSSASILRLDIRQFEITENTITANTHHDIILNILRNPKMRTVNTVVSLDFIGYLTPKLTLSLENLILNIHFHFKGPTSHEYKALLGSLESLPTLKLDKIISRIIIITKIEDSISISIASIFNLN